MNKHYYDEPTQEETCHWEEDAYAYPAEAAFPEAEEEAFSYADEDHTDDDDAPEKPAGKGSRQKSPERLSREAQFLSLYKEYMHPSKEYSAYRVQCQLDDLYALLYQLNRGWAYSKAKSYKLAGFTEADGEDALSVGCVCVYELLKEDRAAGNDCGYPIGHYLKIAQNKAIDDYFRKEFGRLPSKKKPSSDEPVVEESSSAEDTVRRRKVPYSISLDAPVSDDNGRYRGERLSEASVDPFANLQRSRWERDDKANRLTILYLRELMDYPLDPPKPLAVMYGSVLYQLVKDQDGNDEFSALARKSTKVTSPEWAHQRMGKAKLIQLGAYSERIVQKCYHKSLSWGSSFNQHMLEREDDGRTRKWADIIYTETYTESNTSNWIESISKSTMIKCARKLNENPDLKDYAIETFGEKNKFRKALEKMEKEACR